ncbi:MAG: PEPxxWA-CTERM sorting domain-containing protein [Sphingomicrobium sp.]
MDRDTNISAAIARSRRFRRAQRTRRRRIVLAACASALAGFPLSLSLFGVSSSDVVHAAAAGAESLSDLLDQRSPGERTAARLTKTKHAKALTKHMAKAAPHIALAPPDKPNFDQIADLLQSPGPIDIAPPFAEIAATFPEPGIIPVPGLGGGGGGRGGGGGGGGGIIPPGGGGGGPPVTIPTSEPHTPIPVTPLPEPGTWATMLLGFGLLGWRLRRREPHRRPATSAI